MKVLESDRADEAGMNCLVISRRANVSSARTDSHISVFGFALAAFPQCPGVVSCQSRSDKDAWTRVKGQGKDVRVQNRAEGTSGGAPPESWSGLVGFARSPGSVGSGCRWLER